MNKASQEEMQKQIEDLKEKQELTEFVLEDIRINLEGDFDCLPKEILAYKLKMIKAYAGRKK